MGQNSSCGISTGNKGRDKIKLSCKAEQILYPAKSKQNIRELLLTNSIYLPWQFLIEPGDRIIAQSQ